LIHQQLKEADHAPRAVVPCRVGRSACPGAGQPRHCRTGSQRENIARRQEVDGRADPFGAHIAVYLGDERAIHLCQAVGVPTIWTLGEFRATARYVLFIGAKRIRRQTTSEVADEKPSENEAHA
jgi:hypothetical protein